LTDLYFALAFLLCTSIFCCSIVKVQFRSPFRGEPVYYITTFSLCQEVFQNFFKFFSTFFQALVVTVASLAATSLLYHIRFALSRGFSKVFWIFFKSFSLALSSSQVLLSNSARSSLLLSSFLSYSLTFVTRSSFTSRDSFNILPLSTPFVKYFFETFLGLEKMLFSTNTDRHFCAK